jgi:hypothetical protein
MLSKEKFQQIEPSLKKLSEEESVEVIESLYEMAELALENWVKEKSGSKNLEWLLLDKNKDIK